MSITLSKAGIEEVECLHKMQIERFKELLQKYNDIETSERTFKAG